MRSPLSFVALLVVFAVRADEPRINRISPAAKDQARQAFAEIVQCGPRLWARIHGQFAPDDDSVLRTIVLFDGAQQARDWGFLPVPSAESDPERRIAAQAAAAAAGRTAIQMAAFREGGPKGLGPHVARLLASPAQPVIRDATHAEIWYLWMLVPYDLDEPIFVIEVASTRVLVHLDGQHKIHWVDVLPDGL